MPGKPKLHKRPAPEGARPLLLRQLAGEADNAGDRLFSTRTRPVRPRHLPVLRSLARASIIPRPAGRLRGCAARLRGVFVFDPRASFAMRKMATARRAHHFPVPGFSCP